MHSPTFINLKDERNSHDDGLFHRVLFASPAPPSFLAEEIGKASTECTKLHALFYHIQHVHSTPREYWFSLAAITLVNQIFNKYNALVRKANQHDFFLG